MLIYICGVLAGQLPPSLLAWKHTAGCSLGESYCDQRLHPCQVSVTAAQGQAFSQKRKCQSPVKI